MENENSQEVDEFEVVANALELAKEYSMEIEVLTTAFRNIKENPELTIQQALSYALADWDI